MIATPAVACGTKTLQRPSSWALQNDRTASVRSTVRRRAVSTSITSVSTSTSLRAGCAQRGSGGWAGAGLDLLDGPGGTSRLRGRVAVGIGETEQGAAVAFVDDCDLPHVDATVGQLAMGRGGVGTTSCTPLSDPGAMACSLAAPA